MKTIRHSELSEKDGRAFLYLAINDGDLIRYYVIEIPKAAA